MHSAMKWSSHACGRCRSGTVLTVPAVATAVKPNAGPSPIIPSSGAQFKLCAIAVPSAAAEQQGSVEELALSQAVLHTAALQAASPHSTVDYRFVVPQFVTKLGENLRVVGSLPELGAWSVALSPAMVWQEGHRWFLQLRLPKADFMFKVVVVAGSVVRWEQGDNRVVQATGGTGAQAPVELVIQLSCSFDETTYTGTDLVISAPDKVTESFEVAQATLELLNARRAGLVKALQRQEGGSAAAAEQQAEADRLAMAMDQQGATLQELGAIMQRIRRTEDGQSLLALESGKVVVPAALLRSASRALAPPPPLLPALGQGLETNGDRALPPPSSSGDGTGAGAQANGASTSITAPACAPAPTPAPSTPAPTARAPAPAATSPLPAAPAAIPAAAPTPTLAASPAPLAAPVAPTALTPTPAPTLSPAPTIAPPPATTHTATPVPTPSPAPPAPHAVPIAAAPAATPAPPAAPAAPRAASPAPTSALTDAAPAAPPPSCAVFPAALKPLWSEQTEVAVVVGGKSYLLSELSNVKLPEPAPAAGGALFFNSALLSAMQLPKTALYFTRQRLTQMSSEVTNLLEQLSKGSDQQPDLAKAVDQLEAIMKEAQAVGVNDQGLRDLISKARKILGSQNQI